MEVPSIEIESISKTGEIKILFSDAFVVQKDLDLIRTKEMLTLIVLPVEDDQTEEQVRFDWTVNEFTETGMVI